MVNQREQLSAFMDDQLEPAQESGLARSWDDPEMLESWNLYHLIGEALREQEVRGVALGQRVFRSLEQETVVPLQPPRPRGLSSGWSWLAMAATVAAISLTIGTMRTPEGGSTPPTRLGQTTAPTLLANQGEESASPGSGRVAAAQWQQVAQTAQPYLALHRQWSPLSGFQTVDFETGSGSTR